MTDAGLPEHFRREMPTVTVVLVNLNGKDLLGPCLDSLVRQTYDRERIEIVLVDNASTDGSVDMVRRQYPEVRVVVNDTNVGFSPAVNQAAKVAGGEFLALLNNDAEAEPDWLAEGIGYLMNHDEVGCVGSLILSHDRESIDYAGGGLAFNGMGYAMHFGESPEAAPVHAHRTLFASGGAMITPTQLFLDVGGFDESYFAFFEDVDFGWRLWVLGHEVHIVPRSKVRHRHHGTIKRFGYARERYLLERNALATIFKNYGDDALARALPGALLLTAIRGLDDLPEGEGLPDFAITPDAPNLDADSVAISALTAAHLAALRDFGRALPSLTEKRHTIQGSRRRVDSEILPLLRLPLRPNVEGRVHEEVWKSVVEVFGLEELVAPPHVLIVTGDVISERMAGPAIRAYEMASLLTRSKMRVTLGTLSPPEIDGQGFEVMQVHGGNLPEILARTSVVVFQGFAMHHLPMIRDFPGPILVDLYDPFHLEGINLRKEEPPWVRFGTFNSDLEVVSNQLRRGDFFVCASESQRDLWMGQLAAEKRVNPATFDEDEGLRALIDVAPFGLPEADPVASGAAAIRGAVPGIDQEDFVLIWGGGIYNWFDPLTLIRAVGRVVEEHPRVKLFFMGKSHPSVPRMAMGVKAEVLAEELGLLGTHVFFNEGWVDYDRRQDYLLEADVGVSTHFEHIETRYAFRTRILDYLWCELPILATSGDTLSAMVQERQMGLVVPPEDVGACADAITRLLLDRDLYDSCVARIQEAKPEMTWERALAPVVEFCQHPRRATDAGGARRAYIAKDFRVADVPVPEQTASYYVQKFLETSRSHDLSTAFEHARNIVRHRLANR